ncbi:PiggyBac transposable element-derived protein 3 [Frankliniella fusca]|uniref:PiggyBac transposable element-derived protein 3 n=1 Tax=Frankliniella fusca TaxID=407009 RepID=A0AAE1LKM9_9NEOP|nr:PiggyBac transposable element-derived protein 3 [Frankliniella fusca]
MEENLLLANDRFAKIRPLLVHMKEKCNDLYQEEYFSIDETMVPYKGRFAGSLRQFIMNKPHRFGIKIFNVCGSSGIIYDFLPYAGSETFQGLNFTTEENEMGVGAKVVIGLSQSITDRAKKCVFFDNYFASAKLSTGAVRSNRIDNCPLISDKELKKRGRGSYDFMSKDGVQITKWMDSKVVHMAHKSKIIHEGLKV